jgi:hypothetical protein
MFVSHSGKTMCARCASQYNENVHRVKEAFKHHSRCGLEEIAAYAAVSVDDVRQIMEDPCFREPEPSEEPPCARCKERPAQQYAQFCLVCRLDLNKAFGQAARVLASQIEHNLTARRTVERIKQASVTRELERKRAVNPVSRLAPRPRNRYSSG